ncbi:MAG: phosphomannomutase/phosphoglucomutase [Candidatus Sungbacteria bacterium]|uniref:Phosphomannomutase/phosphoglucomutase n=1 Tax=Candidatus Sungiibacteriota bacterium TaxID=2750080 RepID=A0A933DTG0_9BACT|nr:phosphomannomutase/phosphoglucomutase [Candidatus Sungbacteria bacterium]
MKINPEIFRAYDIRGRYPGEINESAAAAIARGFAAFVRPKSVVIARDVRLSGPKLAAATREALRRGGVDIIDIGVVPADVFYFGVVKFKADGGVYLSASHNPREWNGMNMCRKDAKPISGGTGLKKIQKLALANASPKSKKRGRLIRKNVIDPYLDFVWSLAPIKKPRPLTIVLNANFGVSARLFRRILQRHRLPFRVSGINDRADGRFPKGPPDPLLLKNQRETERAVGRAKADLGFTWDADGDRCFFTDEKGRFVPAYFITAILAGEMLQKRPRSTIITDPRLTWATRDTVRRWKGKLVVAKPGMTLIAERMAKERAAFAGEMSGHYYFRDTFNRDNGFLPALMMMNIMLRENKKLSEIAAPFRQKYFVSGEINFPLTARERAVRLLKKVETKYRGGKISHTDGLSIEYPRWRFNLRPSNTEPLLRLNIEAKHPDILARETKKLSKLILTTNKFK